MEPLAHHLMLRPADDRAIAPSTPLRRRVAGTLLRVTDGAGLLAFRAADTHLHLLLAADRASAGRSAQAVSCALRAALGFPFSSARVVPVRDQHHLVRTFHYVLRQAEHHGIGSDPLHEASLLPDLLGLRWPPPAAVGRVRERLPRIRAEDLWAHAGVAPLAPSGGVTGLPDAAAAAFGLEDLTGRGPAVVVARRALARQAAPLGSAAIAVMLGCDASTAWRLRGAAVPAAALRAVGLQVALREALAGLHDPTP